MAGGICVKESTSSSCPDILTSSEALSSEEEATEEMTEEEETEVDEDER